MIVSDIPYCLQQFRVLFTKAVPFDSEFSKAWHFNLSYKDHRVPFNDQSGVYIYSKVSSPQWDVPLDQNSSDIWYIGKSQGNIGGRVWKHMGLMYDPKTGEPCDPRFKYHDWADDDTVPSKIRASIVNGETVVYTIKIAPNEFDPQVVEKFLLACHYRTKGILPPLNREI